MEPKFVLPSPKFDDETKSSLENFSKLHKPHFSTPMGMQLPKSLQPPPMFGPRGPTIPPKFLNPKKGNRPPMTPKKVVQEKPPVSNWDAYCEICDIEFKNTDELENHKREHQKCEVDGCKYVGHSKYMNKHLEIIHVSGLFERMKKAQASEKTEKWRIERKRNYPTKENILLRMQAQEERFKRGERIEEPKSKFGEKTTRFPPNETPSKKRRRNPRKKVGPKTDNSKNVKDTEETCLHKKFKGTSDLVEYRPPSKGLSLLAAYGSGSDETDEDENLQNDGQKEKYDNESTGDPTNDGEVKKTETQERNEIEPKIVIDEKKQIVDYSAKLERDTAKNSIDKTNHNKEKIGETSSDIQDQKTETPKKMGRHRKKRSHNQKSPIVGESSKTEIVAPPMKKSILDYSKLRRTPQNTLLEKLIQPDIRHERNVLLQCVRYVVTNNFFGIGNSQKLTTKEESTEENEMK